MTSSRILIVACCLAAAAPAAAAGNRIARHGDWEAYSYREKNAQVCYVASLPKKSEGSSKERGDHFVMVTHRPAEKSLGVFSVSAGYAYRKGSEVEVEAGGHKLKLFTDGDGAWARDDAGDKAVVAALAKGGSLVVRGTPAKGAPTVDTYSLTGFPAALAEINRACGVK